MLRGHEFPLLVLLRGCELAARRFVEAAERCRTSIHLLHRLELRNAIELAVFQKRATATEAAEVWKTVEADVSAGLLTEVSLSLADLFAKAQELVANHTAATGARSLDVLHVAAASLLGVEEVVTFDQRQSALALRLTLKVAAL